MPRLSKPIHEMQPHYQVVVVGSGYGGGITASRLSRAGRSVCVLERGREFQPGEYPDTEPEMLRELQVDTPKALLGSRTGLYDVRMNDDINVFLGCGLGGTSLVNANVSLPAEPWVFDDPAWPAAFRQDVPTLLQQGFDRAKEMLGATPYPADFPTLAKLTALEQSATAVPGTFYRPPINVTFKDGVNQAGVPQKACILCGDCVTGCNHHAKNTTLMNYLPDARNHGAEIFVEVGVRFVERRDGQWFVHYQPLETGREAFDAPTLFVTADLVVLSAGALGSTEILLRSKARGLLVSNKLGHNFSGNGDVLAFSYNSDQAIDGIGFGNRDPKGRPPVGPCITGIIDERKVLPFETGMVIEEGSLPGPIASFLPVPLAQTAAIMGKDTDTGLQDLIEERQRELESLANGPYTGAMRNTQTYLVMTHDGAGGQMVLDQDRLRIQWPGIGKQPIFTQVNDRLHAATKPIGGTFLKNPLWSKLTNHNLITVHPLGGCPMGETAATGVVDHRGQVFAGATGADVHEGLYVADGSVMPRSLGVNPLLTISAAAERTCALIAKERGWQIDYTLPSQPPAGVDVPIKPGVRFTETMRGFWLPGAASFADGATRGKAAGSTFEFTLTVVSHDLEAMLTNSEHDAKMVGTATAPGLSAEPMTVANGLFNLFVTDPTRVGVRLMRYRMQLSSQEGKRYFFEGFKEVRKDGGAEIWTDTSTLYITVHDGDDATAPILGQGVLVIEPKDFMKQMTTMEVTNATSMAQRLDGLVRFGMFFMGALQDVYGGVLKKANELNPDAPPRKRRALRLPAPEVHHVTTADRAVIRLTRYQGGSKGPVMLAPGFGTSTLAYTIDTVETNLPEFLVAHGYDVWLFDYRASPDLEASTTQFSIDEVATRDWPAAIGKVRELTQRADVQVMAHCIGSMSFLMGLASGVHGVRSAVASSLSFFPISPTANEVKAGLQIGSFLTVLGVETMTTDFDPTNWKDRLLDAVIKLGPTKEACDSAVCRRILLIYGEVYKHAQLNDATHRAIHEMFGVANLTSFNHIGLMVRKGHSVDKDGKEAYLPHLDRLALPITFVHGVENRLFFPEGTLKTFKALSEANGANLYKHVMIPNYAHMDLFIGRDSARDVYPSVVAELDRFN